MNKKIVYWLLTRCPRPVAVVYAMLVQLAITNAANILLALWGIVVVGLATVNISAAFIFIMSSITIFLGWIVSDLIKSYYKQFDEALPKREKKQEEVE